ncbi:MAG: hypothetical protein ACOC93_05750 [Planctomycetota bacterium]
MPKAVEIAVLVLVPLAWGLGVEYVFERLRRQRAAAAPDLEESVDDPA